MIRSMTGFGQACAEVDGVIYTVEIRSVNNRYFKDIKFVCPISWRFWNAMFEKIASSAQSPAGND